MYFILSSTFLQPSFFPSLSLPLFRPFFCFVIPFLLIFNLFLVLSFLSIPFPLLLLPSWFSLVHFFPLSSFFFLSSVFISILVPVFYFQRLLNNTRRNCWYESFSRKGIYHFLFKRFATSSSPNHRLPPVTRRYTSVKTNVVLDYRPRYTSVKTKVVLDYRPRYTSVKTNAVLDYRPRYTSVKTNVVLDYRPRYTSVKTNVVLDYRQRYTSVKTNVVLDYRPRYTSVITNVVLDYRPRYTSVKTNVVLDYRPRLPN